MMPHMPDLPDIGHTAGNGGILAGRVGGAVLATMRGQLPMTQEELAERLQVSPTTVQAWERGRKPLVNMPFARLQNLRRELDAAGADPGLLWLWDKALHADVMLAALDTPDPQRHPLAQVVPDRTATELLSWPLSGQLPRQLAKTSAVLPVGRGELAAVTAALRDVADQAGGDGERPSMLRRQVKFLLAKTDDPVARQWAADAELGDLRSPGDLRQWTPRWPVARSAAHVAAAAGDLDPMHRFIDQGLSDDRLILANLNYWAYWAGEYPALWNGDSAMTQADGDVWSGTRLLGSLLRGIVHAPYRDLCAHTLWALLLHQRQLAANPQRQSQIQSAISQALQAGDLAPAARQRLEQVNYLVRST
jgi:transcriptional regulator with XRE-family HTH domain